MYTASLWVELAVFVLAFDFLLVQSQKFETQSLIFNEADCPTADKNTCECKNKIVHSYDADDEDLCDRDVLCVRHHRSVSQMSTSDFIVRDVTSNRNKNDTGHTITDENNSITYRGSNYKRYVKSSNMSKFLKSYKNSPHPNFANRAPWNYVINRDLDRDPQDILEAECLFSSCLNIHRNESNRKFRVHPMMVTRYFTLNETGPNQILNAEFSIACFCEFSSAAIHNDTGHTNS